MKWILIFCLSTLSMWANSLQLVNNSEYTLRATIYDAKQTVLGEIVLNVGDAMDWTDDYGQFGTDESDYARLPYMVRWYCMTGAVYGVCRDVGSGTTVLSQNCGGIQRCPQKAPEAMQ
ncbi:MAG: hypothetical protein JSS61_02550 [Verrucomicrobia bacterium]|nr:hypothetical protein [Verrucomicrobiota bacterium]